MVWLHVTTNIFYVLEMGGVLCVLQSFKKTTCWIFWVRGCRNHHKPTISYLYTEPEKFILPLKILTHQWQRSNATTYPSREHCKLMPQSKGGVKIILFCSAVGHMAGCHKVCGNLWTPGSDPRPLACKSDAVPNELPRWSMKGIVNRSLGNLPALLEFVPDVSDIYVSN